MRLKKYQDHFASGAWHVHTNYTDGKSSVDQYCRKAMDNKIPLIAFTEHVWKELNYDFDQFVGDIETAREQYPSLIILSGCEAKVIDLEGNLDVTAATLSQCDIVIGVFHSFIHSDKTNYLTALTNMLKNQKADLWGHPTLFAREKGFTLTTSEITEILNVCKEYGMIIEKNLRYSLPDTDFLDLAKKQDVPVINSGDFHSSTELDAHAL